MSLPNQKKIKIHKEPCDSDNLYSIININALNAAMKNLTQSGTFKLWVYLVKNQDGYSFDLSCVDCSEWGIKKDTYHNSVKELISKGYLQNIGANKYIFYDLPPVSEKSV